MPPKLKDENANMNTIAYALTLENEGALFSPCRQYRHVLWRRWNKEKSYVLIIGLNPSTANENEDDPTIRRCKKFASDWGYGAIYMVNLFDYCATKPKDMLNFNNPCSDENNTYIKALAENAGLILCAWGTNGNHKDRDSEVKKLLNIYELNCLGLNSNGTPKHPLYIKADKELEAFK